MKPQDHHLYEGLEEKRAFEQELLELRWEFKKLKLDYELARFRAKYGLDEKFNPNQPRVPAGSPDGGQWTSVNHDGGRNESVVMSDVSADADSLPGTQYAQACPVDLREDELRGGHAIRAHVNRSPEALVAQAREGFDQNPRAEDIRSGSFPSIEAANKLVNSTLAENPSIVDQVAGGIKDRALILAQFNSVPGIEAVIASPHSQPYFRDTYGVGVIIAHDRFSPRGCRVVTAFPSNR